MSVFKTKIDGVPQFVSYFNPVHKALLGFGGAATPKQVYEWIAQHENLSETDISHVNQNGRPTFENRAAWARFYLTKAGWMYSPKRGVWALTDKGKQLDELSEEKAVELFRSVASQFKGNEESQAAPEDNIQPDDTQYWFVGAMWGEGEGDQTDRFLSEGIWENGYEDKFLRLVHSIKVGDRIAIKSSFSRKHGTPFDNKGIPVSVMKIKAVGTVTENLGDGRKVRVEWADQETSRDWYFYTYRATITRAKVEDEVLARKLVAFTFEGASQDYDFFMAQPYWRDRFAKNDTGTATLDHFFEEDPEESEASPIQTNYGVPDIVAEGCFISEAELLSIRNRWERKKNLILQGPPGTGKTWLAKRLAKALIGQSNVPDEQLRIVQFHPSLSYEDFVRGYRPGGDEKLKLTDGLFLQVVEAARMNSGVDHVLIIEEINRGNPAQVLGEMLTLLEDSKRNKGSAMELAYPKYPGERLFLPENLYVIGTMNIADRSLALVDLALRRRFAFVDLSPNFNAAWKAWCLKKGLNSAFVDQVNLLMESLNQEISQDRALGPQFQIGHSYLTPIEQIDDQWEWFTEVLHSEIAPLLHEYWFDNPERAEGLVSSMIKSIGSLRGSV